MESEKYAGEIENLPTLPHIVIQIMDKIHAPEPNIDELADLVMSDQVLTTRMLRLVNSVFWGLNRTVDSVKEALIYLGLREISNLIYSVSLTNSFEINTLHIKRVRFWEHSFGCALYSRIIAQKVGHPDTEMAYLAGLLHDLGEAIFAMSFPKAFEELLEKVACDGKTFCEAEVEVLGIDHAAFGAWMLEKWGVPERLCRIVSKHHHIEDLEDEQSLGAVMRLADLICQFQRLDFGYLEGEPINTEIPKMWKKIVSYYPGMAREDMAGLLEEFREQEETVKQIVQSVYSSVENAEATVV